MDGFAPRTTSKAEMETLKDSYIAEADSVRTPSESRGIIGQCKHLVRTRLSAIIADALEKLEEDLFKSAEATGSRPEQQVFFEAGAQLKKYRTELAGEFDRRFLEVFDRRINSRTALSLASSRELKVEELTLVTEHDVEEQLIIGQLARKTKNTLDPEQLLGIRARFGHLLATEMLEDEVNPIGPEAVMEALKLTCDRIPGEFAVKNALLQAFQPYIAKGIGAMYADVNLNLIKQRVLPRIKHTVQRARENIGPDTLPNMVASQQLSLAQLRAQSGAPAGMHPAAAALYNAMGGAAHFGGPNAMGQSMSLDLSTLLAGVLKGPQQARVQVARMLSEPSRYAFEGAMSTPASPALLASLSRLQGTADVHATEGQAAIDFLQHLDREVRASSHPLDQLTIELVTMVFDHILDDKSITATVKAEISRLQIVAVKAALLDRTFFARRQHPMRKLLDRISEASHDPDVDLTAGSSFINGLRSIVDDIIANFNDDLAVFTVAFESLEGLVSSAATSRQQDLQVTERSLEQQERAAIAHAAALAEIRRRVKRAPPFVREFLTEWWAKALVDSSLRDLQGEDSWTHRLGIVDALAWSVGSLKKNEIQQLAGLLPKLVRSLIRGMTTVNMPPETRQAFFNHLMEAHTATINESKARGALEEAAVEINAREPDVDDAQGTKVELKAVEPAGGDYHLHTVMALERGTIVEFLDGADAVRAKLTWISPEQTILLFTSAQQSARQLAPAALAQAFATGKARLVEASVALMDRVMQAVVGPVSVAGA
jgi:hypothetical protein